MHHLAHHTAVYESRVEHARGTVVFPPTFHVYMLENLLVIVTIVCMSLYKAAVRRK